MEQIAQEQTKLLARKAQLQDELTSVEAQLRDLSAFAQGFKAATPQEDPKE